MSLLEGGLNIGELVGLVSVRDDSGGLEDVIRGEFGELVCDLAEVVEHGKVGLADPGELGLAGGTHGGVARAVLVVFVLEEARGVAVKVLEVLVIVSLECRVVLGHHINDLCARVLGDTADRRAKRWIRAIAVL